MKNKDNKRIYALAAVFLALIAIFAIKRSLYSGTLVAVAAEGENSALTSKSISSREKESGNGRDKSMASEVMDNMDGSILFFGRVIDHNGNPIPGASINYITATAKENSSMIHDPISKCETNNDGLFEIRQGRGMSLSVRTIEKEGYRFVTGGKVFSYGYGSNSNPHRPDPKNPVEFLLVPSDLRFDSVIRPPSTGVKLIWNSESVELPIGKSGEILTLRPKRSLSAGKSERFSWSVEVEVKNGTILTRKPGEILMLAPLEGYQKRVVLGYKEEDANWQSSIMNQNLAFKTSEGRYGRITIDVYANNKDGQIGARLFFAFNPTGERFLD